MQNKYDEYWEKVKEFFYFKLLVGPKIAEIVYFVGFVLITVYGIRALIFVVGDRGYGLSYLVSRWQLAGLILLQIPIAHVLWRMLIEAFIGIFRILDKLEAGDRE